VETYGNGLRGLAQHAVKLFATALEVIPRTLAENALGGAEGNEVVSRLWAKHEERVGRRGVLMLRFVLSSSLKQRTTNWLLSG